MARGFYRSKVVFGHNVFCKFGINRKHLNNSSLTFLEQNPQFADIKGEQQVCEILFRLNEHNLRNLEERIFICPVTGDIKSIKEIELSSYLTDWNCCVCNTPIKSNILEYKFTNFLCNECKKVHKKVDQIFSILVKDSELFRKHSDKILKLEKTKQMNFIRRNERIKRELCNK